MQMSVEEIKRNYDQAKNKKQQIRILADLNCCSREEIEKVLEVESNRKAIEPPKEYSLSEAMDVLFARLDELEGQIKSLETEYQKITVAIEILGNMKKVGAA